MVDVVETQWGNDHPLCVVGACSGGYLAFHEAVSDTRIKGLILINVQRFLWVEGTSLDAVMRSSGKSAEFYRQRIFDPQTWMRLIRGDLNLAHIGQILLFKNLNRLVQAFRQASARFRRPCIHNPKVAVETHDSIRRGFASMAARGTKIVVIYGEEDGGRDEFARYFGANGKGFLRLKGARLLLLPETDHNLTSEHARNSLFAEIIALCTVL